MLSNLTIISIFTEIFAAGLLIAGGISFIRKYFQENLKKDLYLGSVFGLLFVYVALTVVSQMMFNLGRNLSELIFVHKLIYSFSTMSAATLWFYLITKYKFNQIKWVKYATWAVLVAAAIICWRIFTSAVSLVYRQEVIEPLVEFSQVVPVKTVWVLIWLALAAISFWRLLSYKPSGRKNLTMLLAISSLLIVVAYVTTILYSTFGQSYFLLLSWVLTLLAVTGILLSEIISPFSNVAASPLSYFRTRILFKLILIFVLLIVIVFEATTLIIIGISKKALSDAVVLAHKTAAREAADKVDGFIKTAIQDVKIVAETAVSPAALKLLLDTNRAYESLAIVNAAGQMTTVYDKNGAKLSLDEINLSGMRQAFSEKKAVYLSPVLRAGDGVSYLVAAVQAREAGSAVIAKINLAAIQQIVNQITYRGFGVVYLVDQAGKILAHPDEIRAKGAENISELAVVKSVLKGKSGGGMFFSSNQNEEMVGAYVPVEDLGWGVIIEEPAAKAYFEIRRVETNSLIFVIIGITLTVLVGVFFAKTMEKPIMGLIAGTDAVRQGNLNFRIEVDAIDEIGTLATAFNLMTKELRESQDRLVLSEKLASLGTMAAGMAHEIKNPLVSLRTFTQLLQQKWEDEEYRKKFIQIVPHEIERINKIAESLLKFGKPMKPELTKVDINAVLEDVLLLFESEAKKNNVRVTTKFADLPLVVGDQGQLSQAMVNIILNGIQSMKKGGELTVKTDVGEVIHLGKVLGKKGKLKREGNVGEMTFGEDDTENATEILKPTGVVFIEITDSGEGIPPENLKSLFDPFFTTKMTGTGMGLPITLRIIEEHRGSIKVRSQVDVGTTFLITIPQNLEEQKEKFEEKIENIE